MAELRNLSNASLPCILDLMKMGPVLCTSGFLISFTNAVKADGSLANNSVRL